MLRRAEEGTLYTSRTEGGIIRIIEEPKSWQLVETIGGQWLQGCDDTRTVRVCDPGYRFAHQNTLSWRTPTSPLPPETNPRAVFERLFGTDDMTLSPELCARRTAGRKSILDMVREGTQRVESAPATPTGGRWTSTCMRCARWRSGLSPPNRITINTRA